MPLQGLEVGERHVLGDGSVACEELARLVDSCQQPCRARVWFAHEEVRVAG